MWDQLRIVLAGGIMIHVESGIPRGLRTFLVAAFDVAGNRSAGVAALVVDLGDQLVDNVIKSVDLAAQGFPGTVTGGALVAGALTATSMG